MPFFDHTIQLFYYSDIQNKKTPKKNQYRRYLNNKRKSISMDGKTSRKKAFHHKKASLTVEAAFVIPLVLYAWMLLISLVGMTAFKLQVQSRMTQAGRELAVLASDNETLVKSTWMLKLYEAVEDIRVPSTAISEDVGGIHFIGSEVLEGDAWLHLQAVYQLQPIYPVFGLTAVPVEQWTDIRAWKGYDGSEGGGMATDDCGGTVYVAENGVVYHTDRSCSHIKLNIQRVSEKKARTYPACERCGDMGGLTYYVTESGGCYHKSLSCSGLKRTVEMMERSEAEAKGLFACSRCGK